MENILFYFANFPVYSYGAMLGLGLLIGSCLAQQEGKRKGFGPDFIFNFVVGVALAFMLGGRIYTVYQVHGWRMILYPWVLFSGLQMDERAGGLPRGLRHLLRPPLCFQRGRLPRCAAPPVALISPSVIWDPACWAGRRSAPGSELGRVQPSPAAPVRRLDLLRRFLVLVEDAAQPALRWPALLGLPGSIGPGAAHPDTLQRRVAGNGSPVALYSGLCGVWTCLAVSLHTGTLDGYEAEAGSAQLALMGGLSGFFDGCGVFDDEVFLLAL